MRQGFRPYTKQVTLTTTNTSQLVTHDTEGTTLQCNYCRVEPVSGAGLTTDGVFFVTVNMDSGLGYTNNDRANNLKTNADASGSLGMGASRQTGSVVISTLSPDTFNAIKISQSNTTATTYLITYGVVSESNNLKDSTTFRGN